MKRNLIIFGLILGCLLTFNHCSVNKKTYSIKKGKHRSVYGFKLHSGIKEMKFSVKFSPSCWYEPIDWEHDYNKLVGWSYGRHHRNSVRIAWRSHKDSKNVELATYVYCKGKRSVAKPILVPLNKTVNLSFSYNESNGLVTLVDESGNKSAFQAKGLKPKMGYYLFPYFGGNNPAPQNMQIELNLLEVK